MEDLIRQLNRRNYVQDMAAAVDGERNIFNKTFEDAANSQEFLQKCVDINDEHYGEIARVIESDELRRLNIDMYENIRKDVDNIFNEADPGVRKTMLDDLDYRIKSLPDDYVLLKHSLSFSPSLIAKTLKMDERKNSYLNSCGKKDLFHPLWQRSGKR